MRVLSCSVAAAAEPELCDVILKLIDRELELGLIAEKHMQIIHQYIFWSLHFDGPTCNELHQSVVFFKIHYGADFTCLFVFRDVENDPSWTSAFPDLTSASLHSRHSRHHP